MAEAQCIKCEAIFEVNGEVPKGMQCFCNSKEFKLLESMETL